MTFLFFVYNLSINSRTDVKQMILNQRIKFDQMNISLATVTYLWLENYSLLVKIVKLVMMCREKTSVSLKIRFVFGSISFR